MMENEVKEHLDPENPREGKNAEQIIQRKSLELIVWITLKNSTLL